MTATSRDHNRPHARRRPVGAAALAAFALVVAAGCGRSEEPPTVVAPTSAAAESAAPTTAAEPTDLPQLVQVDACALVTKAEAERLAGTPLDDPVVAPEACMYTGPTSGPTAQVEVYVGDGAKKQYDIEQQLDHKLDPVSGAGDEAYIYVDGLMVFVSKAGRWFSIRLVLLDDPAKHRKPLEEQARTAATRF